MAVRGTIHSIMILQDNPVFDTCIILHGCPPNATNIIPKNERWMNWIAQQLNAKGFRAYAPDMPTPWAPVYSEWKKEFENSVITEKTILVGHSCGAAFLVRWLLETKKKVGKLILVAPAKVPENSEDTRKTLYEFFLPKDASYIAKERIIFTSNDFPHHLKSLKRYVSSLKPKVITLENKGHFLKYSMGSNQFPELLEEILRP